MPSQYTYKPGKGLVNVNAQPVQNQYNNVNSLKALSVTAGNLTATGNVDFSSANVSGGAWLQPVIDANDANAATISGQQAQLNSLSGAVDATAASILTVSGRVTDNTTLINNAISANTAAITNFNTTITTDNNILTKQGVIERDAYYLIWGNENTACELNTSTTALAGPIKWMMRAMGDPLIAPSFSTTVSGVAYRDGVWSSSAATSASISGNVPALITASSSVSGSMAIVFLRLFEQDLVSATPPSVATLIATAQTIINRIVNAGWIPAIVTPVPNASYSAGGKALYWSLCNSIAGLKTTNPALIVLDASSEVIDRSASSFTTMSMSGAIYTSGTTATPTFVGSLTMGKIFRDKIVAQNITLPSLKNLFLGGEEPRSITINPYVSGSNPITTTGSFPPQNLFGITTSGTVMNSASGSVIPPGYSLSGGGNLVWNSISLVQTSYKNRTGLQLRATGTAPSANSSGTLILTATPKLSTTFGAGATMTVSGINLFSTSSSPSTIISQVQSLVLTFSAAGFLAANFPGRPTAVPININISGTSAVTGGTVGVLSSPIATLVYGDGVTPGTDQIIVMTSASTSLTAITAGSITCSIHTISAPAGTFNGWSTPCAMMMTGTSAGGLTNNQYIGTVTAGNTAYLYHSAAGSAGTISGRTLSLCAPTSYTASGSRIMGIADVDCQATSSNLREVVCGVNLTTPVVSGSVTAGSTGYQTLFDGERVVLETPVATTVAGDALGTRGATTLTFNSENMASASVFTVNAFINYLGTVMV